MSNTALNIQLFIAIVALVFMAGCGVIDYNKSVEAKEKAAAWQAQQEQSKIEWCAKGLNPLVMVKGKWCGEQK